MPSHYSATPDLGTSPAAWHSRLGFLLLVTAFFLAVFGASSAHAQGYPVTLSTTVVTTSPAVLRLDWDYRNYFTTSVVRNIYRRDKGDTPWGTPLATLTTSANTLSYSDATVAAGAAYEYKLETLINGGTTASTTGYVSGGVNVTMPENRGKLLLLVDDSQATSLAAELTQLQQDLAGDGWTVLRTDLPRSVVEPVTVYSASVGAARLSEVIAVKNIITTAYNSDPTKVKAVYIVGHLATPYSGIIDPDGHYPQHYGAWPADTYYADINGTWTDNTANASVADDTRNWNVSGDGKFDQSTIPSDLELQVGRVDFKNMTQFPGTAVSETELLRRYLRKAHDYRNKQGAYAAIERRAIVINAFAPNSGTESMVTSISGVIGRDPALVDYPAGTLSPWFVWMENNPSKTYLIGSAQTAGSSTGNGAGSSTDFGLRPSRSVFNVLFGSFMGDFEYANDFMRASLAGNANGDSLGLTCFWGGRPNLYIQSMGLGETIGYSARVSQNAATSLYASAYGSRQIHTALMGDPALRLYSVEPPRNLQAASSNGTVTLGWSASSESALLGYLVYRGDSTAGPFTKLTASPIAPTTYTDSAITAGTAYTYLVKTVKLETTPAGSFINPSSASFATITASNAGTSIPPAPTNLQLNALNSTTLNLTWLDNATGETGYRIERRSNLTGSFSPLVTLAANSTTYTDAGPLTAGITFYYRVIAIGSAGDSLPSQEVFISGQTGSFMFASAATNVSRAGVSYVDVPVLRIGGSTGSVSVHYATEAGAFDTAKPGIDYTATSGTLTFAEGETLKLARITLLKSSPQPVHKFSIRLSSPTGGAQLASSPTFTTVIVEDPSAPLSSPWQTSILGENIDPGAVEQIGNDITSIFWGGAWNTSYTESGRFIYRALTGDSVLTMKINAPSVTTAALMVRSSATTSNSRMVAVRLVNSTTTGTVQFWTRALEVSPWNIVSVPTTALTIPVPYWARITRTGDQFTGEVSPDGVTWTTLGTASVPGIPSTAQWGFFQNGGATYNLPQRAELTNILAVDSTPTVIVTSPASQTLSSGQAAMLSVSAQGSNLSYQWYQGASGSTASPIAGAQASTYTTPALNSTTSYWVRVTGTAGTVDSATAVLTVQTPLQAWRVSQGLSASGTGTSANDADPDGDGLNNLLEYALGTQPLNAASCTPASGGMNGSFLMLVFPINPSATDLTYVVQGSANLVNWTDLATRPAGGSTWSETGATVSQNANIVTATDTVPFSSHGKYFMRLNLTNP